MRAHLKHKEKLFKITSERSFNYKKIIAVLTGKEI